MMKIHTTYNDKIMIAKVRDIDAIVVLKNIIELCLLSKDCDNQVIVKKIKEIVPEYISKNSEFENLDAKKIPVLPVVETF